MQFDPLSNQIIGCLIEVHKELGPGLLESSYEQCAGYEFTLARLAFAVQVPLPVLYKGVQVDCGYRIDMLVENRIILEFKSVEQLLPIHTAQLLTYMKLAQKPIGLLINFNVLRLKDGIKRYVL